MLDPPLMHSSSSPLMVIGSDVEACAYINLGLSKVDKQTLKNSLVCHIFSIDG